MSKRSSIINSPAIILDRTKLSGEGFAMSGAVEAVHSILEIMQRMYVQTHDKTERKVLNELIEALEQQSEQMTRDMYELAANCGAIRLATGEEGNG